MSGKMSVRLATLLLVLTVAACGGGGSGGDANTGGTAPAISDLALSRTFIPFMEGGGTGTVDATVNYNDPEADIVSVEVRISDGISLSIPVPSPLPGPSGVLLARFQLPTTQLGRYSGKIWAIDAQGHQSNGLTSPQVTVAVDINGWTARSSPTATRLNDVVWNGSRFVAVGDSGTLITSSDGLSWSSGRSGTTNRLNAIIWDGSQFLAAGDGGTLIRSTDGLSWTALNAGTAGDLNALVWSGSSYVAGGQLAGTPLLLWSSDGQTWHTVTAELGTGRYVYDIAWSGNQFAATTVLAQFPQSGTVLTSADGVNWSAIPVSTSSLSSFSIVWTGKNFVAGATTGTVLVSPDGVNWQTEDTGSSSHLWAVGWNGLNLIAAGNTGLVGSLDQGLSWQTANTPTGIVSLAWGHQRFVGVGESGQIYTAP